MTADKFDFWCAKMRAVIYLVFNRHAAAEGVFSEMLGRWPGDAYLLASRSHVRSLQGHHAGAIADAQELTRRYPARSAADWFNLAFMLDGQERYEEAEPIFREALRLDPKLDRAWYGLGLVLIRLGRLDEAVPALKRNTELQPMSPYGWYQLARVHVDRKERDEAQRILTHLKGFEPKVAAQLARETGLLT